MPNTIRIRVARQRLKDIQALAKAHKTSVSGLFREALQPYLAGERALPKMPQKGDTATCVVVKGQDEVKIRDLANECNLSVDEAVRIMLETYLQTQPNELQTNVRSPT